MPFSGVCGIWAQKSGDFTSTNFPGDAAGLAAALAYCAGNGVVQMYPGGSAISIPTVPAGVTLIVHEGGTVKTYGGSRAEFNPSGFRRNDYYNVLDYPSVAAAIAAVPAGSALYFPSSAGPYTPPDANGWTINKALEIFSDGPKTPEDKCFQYFNSGGALNQNSVVFALADGCSGFYLHDAVISNAVGMPASNGTGDAIRFDGVGPISEIRIERTNILYAGRSAVRFVGNGYGITISIADCVALGCRSSGWYFNLCNVINLFNVSGTICRGDETPDQLRGGAFTFIGCQDLNMIGCVAEECGQALTNADYEGYIVLENCHNGQIVGCHIEDAGAAAIKNGIILNASRAIKVAGNGCGMPSTAGSKGIHLVNGSKGNTILSNNWSFMEHAVKVDSASVDIGNVIHPQMVLQSDATSPGKVTLPAGGRNFALMNNLASGLADNKGVGILMPSVADESTVDATVKQAGLQIYDSSDKMMKFHDGTNWRSGPVLNVKDFPTFQAAHDALPATGGTIFVPMGPASGTYSHATTPAFAGSGATPALVITKPCHILGEGGGEMIPSVRDFSAGAEDRNAILIERSGRVTIENLIIAGEQSAGDGNLIEWFKADTYLDGVTLKNVQLLDAPAWAFKSVPSNGFYTARLKMLDVKFGSSQFGGSQGGALGTNGGDVLIGGGSGTGSNNLWFERCEFYGPSYGTYGVTPLKKGCVHFNSVAIVVFQDCTCQGPEATAFLSMESWITNVWIVNFYSETIDTVDDPVWRISYDSSGQALNNVFIINADHYQRADPTFGPRFLKTGPTNNVENIALHNVLLRDLETPSITSTDEIVMGNAGHIISLDNVRLYSAATGTSRAGRVTGGGIPSVASASVIDLPGRSRVYQVTGTTNISTINATFPGDVVTLIFNGILTVNDAAGNLRLQGNFLTSADDTLTIAYDGSNWHEVGRSPN